MSERYRWPTSRFEVFSMRFEANKLSKDKDCMIEYLDDHAVPGPLGISGQARYEDFINIDKRFRVDIERDPANFKGRIFVHSGGYFYEIYNSMKRDVLYTDLSSFNQNFVGSFSGHPDHQKRQKILEKAGNLVWLKTNSNENEGDGHTYLPVMGSHLGLGIIFSQSTCAVIVHRDSGNANIDDSYLETVCRLYDKRFLPRFDDRYFHDDHFFHPGGPFTFAVPGFYHSLNVEARVIRDSKLVHVEVKWFMTGENHPSDTAIYICGELSVLSEGRKSLLLKTPLNKAIMVSHGHPIQLLKSAVAVPYDQDFTFSASLGCPNNIDDSSLYFATVDDYAIFSDSDEDDPGLDTLDVDGPDPGTLEEEVPVLDTHEGATSMPGKFYVIRKKIDGTGGFLKGVVYWQPPKQALEKVKELVWEPSISRYGADEGLAEFREALTIKLREENKLHKSSVMVTAGANQAFVNLVLTLCDAGDSVVMFAP